MLSAEQLPAVEADGLECAPGGDRLYVVLSSSPARSTEEIGARRRLLQEIIGQKPPAAPATRDESSPSTHVAESSSAGAPGKRSIP